MPQSLSASGLGARGGQEASSSTSPSPEPRTQGKVERLHRPSRPTFDRCPQSWHPVTPPYINCSVLSASRLSPAAQVALQMAPSLGFHTQLVQTCFFLCLQLLKQLRGPQASITHTSQGSQVSGVPPSSLISVSFLSFSCQECQCYHPLPGPLSPGASLA